MDSDSSAGDDDVDLVYRSSSRSPPYSSEDPFDFFDYPFDFFDNDRQQDEPIDRLSTLPNSTLTQIISFLPTKDAIKTSAISKKFQFLWSLSQTLNLCPDPYTLFDISSFVSSVDQTLILHSSPKLTKFHLQFHYVDHFRSSVDRWISFALKRDVEEIDLDLLGNRAIWEINGKSYKLPFSLCHCSCLIKLSLTCVRFGDRKREIRWNLLKCLSLGYVMLDEALILNILSSCPLLEDFELRECSGFNRLDISSESEGLKRLRIYGYGDFCQSDTELEIWAPKLGSLGIYGSFRRKIKLINVESLVEVTLNFRSLSRGNTMNIDMSYDHRSNELDCKDYGKLVAGLLSQVRSAKNLTLGSRCIEVASTAAGLNLPALGARCLTLETCCDKRDVLGIRHVVALSHHLEKLVLKIQSFRASQSSSKNFSDSYSSKAVNSWNLQDGSFICLQRYLKTVQIDSFSGSHFEIGFAQFLLKHGLVLEKMIICCNKTEYLKSNKPWEEKQLLEVVQKILSFKRASAKAVVLFSW